MPESMPLSRSLGLIASVQTPSIPTARESARMLARMLDEDRFSPFGECSLRGARQRRSPRRGRVAIFRGSQPSVRCVHSKPSLAESQPCPAQTRGQGAGSTKAAGLGQALRRSAARLGRATRATDDRPICQPAFAALEGARGPAWCAGRPGECSEARFVPPHRALRSSLLLAAPARGGHRLPGLIVRTASRRRRWPARPLRRREPLRRSRLLRPSVRGPLARRPVVPARRGPPVCAEKPSASLRLPRPPGQHSPRASPVSATVAVCSLRQRRQRAECRYGDRLSSDSSRGGCACALGRQGRAVAAWRAAWLYRRV